MADSDSCEKDRPTSTFADHQTLPGRTHDRFLRWPTTEQPRPVRSECEPQHSLAQGCTEHVHCDRAVSLARAHRAGVSGLRSSLAAPDVDGNPRHVLPMADEDRDAALRIRTGHAHRPVGPEERIYRNIVQVVDGFVLDSVLASLRAFHPVLPGADASLLVWRKRSDKRGANLDSADRAAPDL